MPKRFLACRCAWVRVFASTQTSTSSGSSDTEANALAVMPWTSPSRSTVIIVTPVAKHPIALRNSAGFKLMVVSPFSPTYCATQNQAFQQTAKARRDRTHRECISTAAQPLTLPRCAAAKVNPQLMYDSIHPRESRTHAVAPTLTTVSALAEITPGVPISRDTALRLIRCSDDDLPELLAAARAAKERFKPGVIMYSRKVFLPLTNLCRDYCGYCPFRRDSGDPGAHTMTPDEVLAVVREGEKLGCTEALFSLGDKPELIFSEMRETLRHLGYKSTLHYLEAMCELVLRETSLMPHPNPGLLSAEWIASLAAVSPSMGLMLETTNS